MSDKVKPGRRSPPAAPCRVPVSGPAQSEIQCLKVTASKYSVLGVVELAPAGEGGW